MRYIIYYRLFALLGILMLLQPVYAGEPLLSDKVMYFPAGTHRLAEIKSDVDFLSIRGDGSGITILEIPGGITLTGKDPRLSGFTLKGYKNRKTGITLKNNYRALIQDVEIQGYELGLLSLCDYGSRQWMHTYRDLYVYEGPDGSMQSYNPAIRGVELRYVGDNKGGWKPDGGFSNTHTFFGGRIAVPGTPLLIDGPAITSLFGTYIDMSDAPLRMTARSAGLQLFGVHLDRNRRARLKGMPSIVLEKPKHNKLTIFGEHTGLIRYDLIVDANNNPVNTKYIHLEPR
ncbi:MAG: hypothetical protein GXP22_02305 [Gammaproteobacteria bacterium]|nr:hypothetical protein [Gammaproteobacteria bacterium]